jgi:hypothetical protein
MIHSTYDGFLYWGYTIPVSAEAHCTYHHRREAPLGLSRTKNSTSENIASAASTASAFAHVPIAAGVPLAATSLFLSSSTLRSRGGRSRPPRQRVCGLGPSPHAILLPDLSGANDKVRIAPGSGRRGIAPTVGGVDALFPTALVLLPLLAMPPFDSVAGGGSSNDDTIKNKGNGGSSGSLAAARPCH